MLEVVIRFLTFEVITVHPMVYAGLGAVWLLLLVASLFSVLSQPIGAGWKAAWYLLILVVPIVGLGCYALRCLFRGDWSFLKPLFPQNQIARKI